MGGYLIFRATNWGPWAFSDSSAYLSAARNIQAGNGAVILNSSGAFTPVTEFPPLYPYILNLLTSKNGDFQTTARWINIISFTISAFIVGLLGFKASRNMIAGFFASTLFAFSPVMIDTFSGFMSEPLFIGLLLLLVFILFEFVQSQKKRLLIPIFIISALLPMTRYAGILFVICVSIILVIFTNKKSQKSILLIPLYLLISLAPIGIWFIDQYTNLNKVGGKSFVFRLEAIKNMFGSIMQEFRIIQGWIPYSGIYSSTDINFALVVFFTGLFFISVLIGVSASIKKWKFRTENPQFLFMICMFFLIAYILFIGFTHNLTIPNLDIIDRMMAPIYPFLILTLILGFGDLDKNIVAKSLGGLLILVAIISSRFYLLSTLSSIRELNADGKGFTSRQYQESEFLEKLIALPLDQPMISNSAAFVLFHTNRYPYPVEQFHNKPFGSGNSYGEKPFRQKNASLIIIFPEFRNYYGKNSDQLLKTLTAGLRVDFKDELGGIYYYPESITPQ